MSPFDLLFLSAVLTCIGALITAAAYAIAGHRARSLSILRRLGFGTAVYFAIVLIVAFASSRRSVRVGEAQCFDDWCIEAVRVARTGIPHGGAAYEAQLRLFSRAKRVSQRENGVVVCLEDGEGRRYDPLPDASAVPLNIRLRPGESAIATRRFILAPRGHAVALVITHEGWFPACCIIGEGPFRKPPAINLL